MTLCYTVSVNLYYSYVWLLVLIVSAPAPASTFKKFLIWLHNTGSVAPKRCFVLLFRKKIPIIFHDYGIGHVGPLHPLSSELVLRGKNS